MEERSIEPDLKKNGLSTSINPNKSDCLEITLSNHEIATIKNELTTVSYDPHGGDNYISAIRAAAYRCMPQRILNILERQKSAKSLAPYLVFTNLPIDDEVLGSPSFEESGHVFKRGCLSENVICAMGSVIGEPYSAYFEGRELVNNLTPQKNTKKDYTGLGSEVELDFHIENAALKFISEDDCSPRGIFLLGIRKDAYSAGPKTFLADSRKALKLLSQEDLEILYGKNFIIRLPYRWRNVFSKEKENTDLAPMVSGSLDLPRLSAVFYPDMVLPANERAKKAFDHLYQAIKSIAIGINISPGNLIYIDNRFTLHSREKYSPTYDQNECPYRWVQRLFITSSLWGFRQFPATAEGGRVFYPVVMN